MIAMMPPRHSFAPPVIPKRSEESPPFGSVKGQGDALQQAQVVECALRMDVSLIFGLCLRN